MKTIARVAGIALVSLAASFAQEGPHFTFDLGAGFSEPVGATGRQLNNAAWNIEGGAGLNVNPWLGAKVDLGYSSFGVNSGTLYNIGVPNGDLHIFSATFDPIVHVNPHGHFDFYLTGGGGIFHGHQEFAQPTGVIVPGTDTFFGFYPTTTGVSQVPGSYTFNRPGIDMGAGFAVGTKFHGKIFAEAKYDRIFVGNYHIDYVPVTFGFRW
jgi:hypothetical protein